MSGYLPPGCTVRECDGTPDYKYRYLKKADKPPGLMRIKDELRLVRRWSVTEQDVRREAPELARALGM